MLQKSPAPPPSTAEPDIAAVLRQGGSSHRLRRSLYLVAVVIVALAGGSAWWWLHSSAATVAYITQPVTRGPLTVTVTATGTVEPTNEVQVSSELSGTIASVAVDYNDTVKKGQPLAMLKTDKLEANVELAKATLDARQADVTQAQASADEAAAAFKRAKELIAKGVASQESYDAAKAANDRAVAAVAGAIANREIAQANLDISQQDLAKACICSPVDGVVLDRAVEVGQTVASSLQAPVLFTLADDLTKMQAEVDIDEADVGKVAQGDRANFTVEAFGDRTFPATISQIRYLPATVEGVVTYKAILTVDNADLALRPGMTATADIVVDQVEDALQVPNAALRYAPPVAQQSRGNSAGLIGLLMPRRPSRQASEPAAANGNRSVVWVLREGKPVRVPVTTGASDGTHTVIVEGALKVDDRVIVASHTTS